MSKLKCQIKPKVQMSKGFNLWTLDFELACHGDMPWICHLDFEI